MLHKPILRLIARKYINSSSRSSSHHSVAYRAACAPASRANIIGAEVTATIMWWWVFWHLFTEPEHITGEFPYPEANQWTNKELGIPKD